MTLGNWKPLKRLRQAIKKVTFLLNLNMSKYRLSRSVLRTLSRRKLSFPDAPVGLVEVTIDDIAGDGTSTTLQRTISVASSSDPDIDFKAEDFIRKFYDQLRMERQVSLELHYVNNQEPIDKTSSG